MPRNQNGLLFMGAGTISGTLGDGRRCVAGGGGSVYRYPVRNSGAGGAFDEGPGLVALSQMHGPAGTIVAGSTWNFQAWFRDATGPCGSGSNLTSAMRVTFTP
ncbi:MAG: hypothetical protein KUG67_02865 [Proteobacteria bacterium]|nr:hypothetical protein [Pseudomonadota bacterium]